ncbi:MAG: addiction module protein [Planctomycetota bacterium]
MSLESMIGGLSTDEKLAAMDLLWRELSANQQEYPSPKWHERVIADRLANPSRNPKMELDRAEAEVRGKLDERRSQG